MDESATVIAIIALLNVVTFCAFWWDKQAARDGDWRVPESRLLGLAFVGGSLGAVAAQHLLRHKTRKQPFRSNLTGIVVLHIVLLITWIFRSELQRLLYP